MDFKNMSLVIFPGMAEVGCGTIRSKVGFPLPLRGSSDYKGRQFSEARAGAPIPWTVINSSECMNQRQGPWRSPPVSVMVVFVFVFLQV